ncbi:hypothetical protein RHGRI_024705 [Rhododendron griersonianum]|uniref:EF-hand domain-containing protein n=1 Tax=Rhododendron griersonianum TaxID=479676 RepID=A0AAV6JBX7_9ERIC|nr:hypothetical protein RHGRI_024705 [Rhododendron griersonianum]
MQKMGTDDGKGEYPHHRQHHSDTEIVGADRTTYSGPLSGPLNKRGGGRKSARFNLPADSASQSSSGGGDDDQAYVEITLDVRDDSVAVHSVKAAGGGEIEDPELTLLAKNLERRSSFRASSIVRNASSRIKQVSQELKKLASFSKRPQGRFDRSKSAAVNALKGLKFISKTDGGAGWAAVEKRFDSLTANTNGLLPRSLFCECIGMNKESKEFAGELFDALSRRRNITGDSINKGQVDKDADGRITEEEVREIISLSANCNKLSNIQKQADEYAALIMEELDPENQGYIMVENLEMLLLQAPNPTRGGGESRNLSQMLSQKLKPTQELNPIIRWYGSAKYFLLDNWQRVWVMALWIGVMLGLFLWKYLQYRNRAAYDVMGTCVCMAKGGAETLKLNMALILLPVCRNTITWLRNKTRLGVAVPFDDNLNFHKVIAVAIAMGVAIHAISHLTCDFPRLIHADPIKYAPMIQYFGYQPKSYWHFVKSFEGISGIIMIVLMAIAFTLASPWFRRSRINLPKPLKKLTGFNAFWYSHHLFVIVYTLLIIHGIKLYLSHKWYKKTTWMYLAVPVLLYVGERLIRAFRSSIKPVQILKVAVYPGNVLALHMSKPQGFKYKSGQYMFVNCSAVSPFEWCASHHLMGKVDCSEQTACKEKTTLMLIDGPYGAPAQDYKKYEVVLLVGLGIGATPMISIVKDIVNNMKAKDEEENALESGNGGGHTPSTSPYNKRKPGSQGTNFKTRRAYFYWVTREQGSFEWFKGIMNEVAELDNRGVIEMHNYCTSVYEEGDARSALIAMLQSLNHAKHGVDVVSGTRVKSHFAKPNWRNVYKRIALNHTDSRVGVFYCGAPALTKELRQLASDFSHKTSTKFDFHKENF